MPLPESLMTVVEDFVLCSKVNRFLDSEPRPFRRTFADVRERCMSLKGMLSLVELHYRSFGYEFCKENFLLDDRWARLYDQMGDDVLVHVLITFCVFARVGGETFVQLSGKPFRYQRIITESLRDGRIRPVSTGDIKATRLMYCEATAEKLYMYNPALYGVKQGDPASVEPLEAEIFGRRLRIDLPPRAYELLTEALMDSARSGDPTHMTLQEASNAASPHSYVLRTLHKVFRYLISAKLTGEYNRQTLSYRLASRFVTIGHFDVIKVSSCLKRFIFRHVLRFGPKLFLQRRGIAQGSAISYFLSDLYLEKMTEQCMDFVEISDLFIRSADDMFYVTSSASRCQRYLQMVIDGVPEFGCQFNVDKTATNCLATDKALERGDKIALRNVQTFSWFGLTFDVNSFEVTVADEALLSCSFPPVSHSSVPQQMILQKFPVAVLSRFPAICFDPTLNDVKRLSANFKRLAIYTVVYVSYVKRRVGHRLTLDADFLASLTSYIVKSFYKHRYPRNSRLLSSRSLNATALSHGYLKNVLRSVLKIRFHP
ncbi:unnamed protein product [Soboliphyme baturini]|uniref:Telomerase reverse transcriptase n=1 Tax=Soboliphyme baturini TaxID=241478 RepID=A0A183IZP8_9BILA|nr:unnamed protein product [Soboliphyme baturini]